MLVIFNYKCWITNLFNSLLIGKVFENLIKLESLHKISYNILFGISYHLKMITDLFSVSVTVCVWVWVCVNECEWVSVSVHVGGQRTTWDLFPVLSFHQVCSGAETRVSRPRNRGFDLLSSFAGSCVILTSFVHKKWCCLDPIKWNGMCTRKCCMFYYSAAS